LVAVAVDATVVAVALVAVVYVDWPMLDMSESLPKNLLRLSLPNNLLRLPLLLRRGHGTGK